MFWSKPRHEKKYVAIPTLYPMGALTFAIACAHCENIGTDLCAPCKEERKSGFEIKINHEEG